MLTIYHLGKIKKAYRPSTPVAKLTWSPSLFHAHHCRRAAATAASISAEVIHPASQACPGRPGGPAGRKLRPQWAGALAQRERKGACFAPYSQTGYSYFTTLLNSSVIFIAFMIQNEL